MLFAFFRVGPDLDLGWLAVLTELDGVANQVAQRHRQTVPVDGQVHGLHMVGHLGAQALDVRRMELQHLIHQRLQLHIVAFHGAPLHAGIVQQIGDQVAHLLHAPANAPQKLAGFLVQFGPVLLFQQLAVAIDAAQRGLEVVRNRIGERLQFLVDAGELLGPLGHALLQLLVDVPQTLLRVHGLGDVQQGTHVAGCQPLGAAVNTAHGATQPAQRTVLGMGAEDHLRHVLALLGQIDRSLHLGDIVRVNPRTELVARRGLLGHRQTHVDEHLRRPAQLLLFHVERPAAQAGNRLGLLEHFAPLLDFPRRLLDVADVAHHGRQVKHLAVAVSVRHDQLRHGHFTPVRGQRGGFSPPDTVANGGRNGHLGDVAANLRPVHTMEHRIQGRLIAHAPEVPGRAVEIERFAIGVGHADQVGGRFQHQTQPVTGLARLHQVGHILHGAHQTPDLPELHHRLGLDMQVLGSIRQHDTVVRLKRLLMRGEPIKGLYQPLLVLGMHQQHSAVKHRRGVRRVEPVNAVGLVRPVGGARRDVNLPVAHAGNTLRFTQTMLALGDQLLRAFSLGDVLHRGEQVAQGPIGFAHGPHIHLHVHDRSVLANESLGQLVAIPLPPDHLVEQRDVGHQVVRVRHFGPAGTHQLVAPVAQNLAQPVVDLNPGLGDGVGDRHADEGQFEEAPHLVGLLALRALGFPAVGDVHQHAGDAQQVTALISIKPGPVFQPDPPAIGTTDSVLLHEHILARVGLLAHLRLDPRQVVRMDQLQVRQAGFGQIRRRIAPLRHRLADLEDGPARHGLPLDHHRRRPVDQLMHLPQALLVFLQTLGHLVGRPPDESQLVRPLHVGPQLQLPHADGIQHLDQALGATEPDQVQKARQDHHDHGQHHRLADQLVLQRHHTLGPGILQIGHHRQATAILNGHLPHQQRARFPGDRDVNDAGLALEERLPGITDQVRPRIERLLKTAPDIGPRQRSQHLCIGPNQKGVPQPGVQRHRADLTPQGQPVVGGRQEIELVLLQAQSLAQAQGLLFHQRGLQHTDLCQIAGCQNHGRHHRHQQNDPVA